MSNFLRANDTSNSPDGSLPPLSPGSASSLQPVAASENPDETYSLTGTPANAPSEFDGNSVSTAPPSRMIPTDRGPLGKQFDKNSMWILIGCNVLVFMSSVCVMVLELTASRLIAKHVGSSLYTWTSVIGVVLAGITIGNFLGGWLADKAPATKLLNWLFLTASILCLSVLWLDGVASSQDRPVGLSWPAWVLCVVGMVFFLPSMALGTISPVVASLALSHSRKVGVTVGNVYAWGAFGSIVGTFLGGFILIDTFGTRAIVALVAGTLAVMGFLSAGSQWAFRSAVLFGWMQFVTIVGLSAAVTDVGARDFATFLAGEPASLNDPFMQGENGRPWAKYGKRLGGQLHALGLTLGLRDDAIGEYHDESNYSYINVTQTTEHGQRVSVLKLDKLIHSYFVTDDPTQLNYDYEKVYAAVTEQSVATWDRTTSVSLNEIRKEVSQWRQANAVAHPVLAPNAIRGEGLNALDQEVRKVLEGNSDDPRVLANAATENAAAESVALADVFQRFPSPVIFDAERQTLSLHGGMTPELRDELLRRHPYSHYWQAIERLAEMTRRADWGDFGSAPLATLPSGIAIPEELKTRVLFDRHLQALNVYRSLDADDVRTLLRLGDSEAVTYREAIERLYRQSRQVGTLFLGGGGFVFPRWIESLFPHEPLIHVAELDPGVKAAVQARMGLPPDDQTRVKTTIGDARNFVDDRVRLNQAAKNRGEKPVLYDFVYGDAFNDFSVPWHLTTKEFSEKIASLLHPTEGIYLVNLIDIYPRTEFPPGPHETLEVTIKGNLPEALTSRIASKDFWTAAPTLYSGLELQSQSDLSGYRLRFLGLMSDELRDRLLKLAEGYPPLADAAKRLYADSRKHWIAGEIPHTLTEIIDQPEEWVGVPAPFEGVEVWQAADYSAYRLAVRGVMSEVLRERLLKLAENKPSYAEAVQKLFDNSRKQRTGRFLGSYVNTIALVFPHVYVFSSEIDLPHANRDTFVIVASKRKLDLKELRQASQHWSGAPFASLETNAKDKPPQARGQMSQILANAHGIVLTDNYAPVDNLLSAVFDER
ncbi:MAG: fused MFS/spermidine synthase [Planctomycetaceae bacterium]